MKTQSLRNQSLVLNSMIILKGLRPENDISSNNISSRLKTRFNATRLENKRPEQIIGLEFTPQQELANVLIHFLGIFFGVVAIPLLISITSGNHNTGTTVSTTIYGLCFLTVFIFSTTYHALKNQYLRRLFKKLDRISIYFFIAGTYTPIIHAYVFDRIGIALLTILWLCVLFGIFFEIFFPDKFKVFSLAFYVLMGLIFLFVPNHFFSCMPQKIMDLFLSGMAFYSVGITFYVWHKWTYYHAIWHAFVLTASVCHYLTILGIISR